MAVTPASFLRKRTRRFFIVEAPRVKKQLPTGAAGCRCDNLTMRGLAMEIKRAGKFSLHFIEGPQRLCANLKHRALMQSSHDHRQSTFKNFSGPGR
jgi:hypothetical protein